MALSENGEERLKAALADRYHIERELGSGGMATVYLAQDLKHDRQVAVKVLDPGLAATLGAERFLREIRTAANLTHPHILPLHDSGEADGFLYYVMPLVAGGSLRKKVVRDAQLPVVEEYYRMFDPAVRYLLDEKGRGKTFVDGTAMHQELASLGSFDYAFEKHRAISRADYEREVFDLVIPFFPFRMASEDQRGADVGPAVLCSETARVFGERGHDDHR